MQRAREMLLSGSIVIKGHAAFDSELSKHPLLPPEVWQAFAKSCVFWNQVIKGREDKDVSARFGTAAPD